MMTLLRMFGFIVSWCVVFGVFLFVNAVLGVSAFYGVWCVADVFPQPISTISFLAGVVFVIWLYMLYVYLRMEKLLYSAMNVVHDTFDL